MLATLLIAVVLTLGLAGATWAQTIRKNPILEQWDFYDERGQYQGRMRKNPVLDRFEVYDNRYRHEGTWQKNPLLDQWQYRKHRRKW